MKAVVNPENACKSAKWQVWSYPTRRACHSRRMHAGMLESLQDMLTGDKDAQVVANCMSVLQQARTALTCLHARPRVSPSPHHTHACRRAGPLLLGGHTCSKDPSRARGTEAS